MPYEIYYDSIKECIMVSVQGELDLALLESMASSVVEIVREVGCKRILNDLRKSWVTEATIDIYNMPETAKQAGVFQACKRALVIGEKTKDFRFLETVFVNQGHQVRMFTGMAEAEEWLFGQRER